MVEQHLVTNQGNRSKSRMGRLFGRYIIKNRLQFKFSFIVFTFLGLASVTMWFQGHWVVQKLIQSGAVSGGEAIAQLNMLNQNILYTSLLALAIVFGLSLFFSHFVAGPIYRMEQTFEQMKAGDLSVIVRFRKNDELQDTGKIFNEALMNLRTKLRQERENVSSSFEKVRKTAEALRKVGRNEEAAQLDAVVFELHNNPPQIKI